MSATQSQSYKLNKTPNYQDDYVSLLLKIIVECVIFMCFRGLKPWILKFNPLICN